MLPPGTLVQGKLANGLALENRIRPIFIGHGFGNYEDRKTARRCAIYSDVRGAEPRIRVAGRNPMIQDVLDAYPHRRIVMTFDVAETPSGHDRAALIDKFGGESRLARPHMSGRAKD